MRYSKIRPYDIANGPGVRTTLFVSGCTHNCRGCFNKEQQSFEYGDVFTKETEDNFIRLTAKDEIDGVNILGGEPMQQTMDSTLLSLLKRIRKETGKEIWLWSGYEFEDIISNPKRFELLKQIDVLVDGKFELEKKNLNLQYRGSSNQRIIDVQKTLQNNNIIVYWEEL